MKYMGSKRRIAKSITPIILWGIRPDQYFIDLFCGGCNLISNVDHPLRVANDVNKPLIALHIKIIEGWIPPNLTKEEYYHIRENQWMYPPEVVGYACFVASFSGKPFSGFAGIVKGKNGLTRNYQDEAKRNILAGVRHLRDIEFSSVSYDKFNIPPQSIIYCDIPYKATTGYRIKFDHSKFYTWCRERVVEKHKLFISEYSMPDDFICIWYGELKGCLSINGIYGSSKKSLNTIEKLFVHKTQLQPWML